VREDLERRRDQYCPGDDSVIGILHP
jgi:hypothetical protein